MRDEFLITRHGKQYVLFAGLLDEAHSRGLRGIDTELVQIPEESNANVAVVKARVEMEDGHTFGGIGDASPRSVGPEGTAHLIRVAETRAKARALRDALNVAAPALEELSGAYEAPPAGYPEAKPRSEESVAVNGWPTESGPPADGGRRALAKARKSQVDLLRTLAVEWRGEDGVGRLENRVGKPLAELTRAEVDEWIDRLTPEGRE